MFELNDDFEYKVSDRYKKNMISMVEGSIADYNEKNVPKKITSDARCFTEDSLTSVSAMVGRQDVIKQYTTFMDTVRKSLVTEAVYKFYSESMPAEMTMYDNAPEIMRQIVTEFVNESGYDTILSRMENGHTVMTEIADTINNTAKAIMESVDKDDPLSFRITPEMKDEFFKQLDYSDCESIQDAINDRVSTAMEDFVTANKKDHEDITAALKSAQEKIAECPPEDTDLKEYYEMKAKRAINEINSAPKSVLHAMVVSMSESVIRHPESHEVFMSEGALNMDKIVNRVGLMYGFMETLNSANLMKIDEAFVTDIINNLKN